MSGNLRCAAEDTESDLVNSTIAKWVHSGNLTEEAHGEWLPHSLLLEMVWRI